MAPLAAPGRRADGRETQAPYLVLGAEVLQNFLAGGAADLHPGGRGRRGRGLPALLPALAPARGVAFEPGSAPRAAAAALAAPGGLRSPLPHAQGIEIQRLALEGALHVAEHAAVLLPRDLVRGARPGQVHGQIVFMGAVPASPAGGHGSGATGAQRLLFPGAERAATGRRVRRASGMGREEAPEPSRQRRQCCARGCQSPQPAGALRSGHPPTLMWPRVLVLRVLAAHGK